jgi:nucleotide-binding universal stress UspA family protein
MATGMAFTKILCPIDFSAGSQQAAKVATRLARDTGAELVLLHAWHIPGAAYPIESVFPPSAARDLAAESRRALDDAVAECVAAGAMHATSALVSGVPWVEIVRQLEKQAYDLCVIGTHGRSGLARVLLGSVAGNVVRHAPCSVLAVRPDGGETSFRHVLVPTDFSTSAEYALELAATLVEPAGALTLLHVIELPVAYSGELPTAELARDLDRRAADALAKDIARSQAATRATVHARSQIGYPGAQTLRVLEDDRTIDLVVMGSHGRTGIARALLGSVAEKIVRHARCPVLVARSRE